MISAIRFSIGWARVAVTFSIWVFSASFALLVQSSTAHAKDVVLIGDSHSCGAFGRALFERLTAKGDRATLYCTESSAPEHWLAGRSPQDRVCQKMTSPSKTFQSCLENGGVPNLETILKSHRGSKFVIALGTNSLGSSRADESYRKMSEAVRAVAESCVWIGPPHLNPAQAAVSKKLKGLDRERALARQKLRLTAMESHVNGFFTSMSGTVGAFCDVVDSRDATFASSLGGVTADGDHRGVDAGNYWATQISDDVARKLAAPKKTESREKVSR